ncbi:uncharacterized protein LOC120330489 [Styela clava]
MRLRPAVQSIEVFQNDVNILEASRSEEEEIEDLDERIQTAIQEGIEEVMERTQRQTDLRLIEMQREIKKMNGIITTMALNPAKTRVDVLTAKGHCKFEYNSKCFQAFVYPSYNVSLEHAKKLCKAAGRAQLANIYDVEHFRSMMAYLRTTFGLEYRSFWTGMGYQNSNGEIHSTTGETITLPDEVWYDRFPFNSNSHNQITIEANKNIQLSRTQKLFLPWYSPGCILRNLKPD